MEFADQRGHSGKAAILDLISYMSARDDRRFIPSFIDITDRLDALRGEDTFATIPELAPLRAAAKRMGTPWGRAAVAAGRLMDYMVRRMGR